MCATVTPTFQLSLDSCISPENREKADPAAAYLLKVDMLDKCMGKNS